MKNLICGLILAAGLMSGSAYGASCSNIDTTGLSDSAAQQVRLACQTALAEAARQAEGIVPGSVDLTDPNKLSAWGQVAQEWAKALGIAANELGIAVDNFLDTDAGKLTALVIIWQVAGESILGFMIGIPLLITVVVVGLRFMRHFRIKEIVYDDKRNWMGRRIVKSVALSEDGDNHLGVFLTGIVTILLSVWIVAGVIF